ncbi:MAG TPA: EF-hand domain-containing protein [Ensifer sp.]|nr:EF-hand domain-containing protein [Ensifer sp.]
MSTITASTSSSYAYSTQRHKTRGADNQNDDSSQSTASLIASLMSAQAGQAGATSTVSDGSSASSSTAQALSSVSSMMLDRQTPPSASDMYTAMDTDGDGSVTEQEFLAAKPDDVSDDQAKALYDSIDTKGTGSITEDQLATSMQHGGAHGAGRMPPPPPPSSSDSSSSSSTTSSSDISDLFASLDTDGDGSVSASEFLAAKPDGMTDDMAKNLYDAIDTDGAGSISLDQMESFFSNGDTGTSATSEA